MASAAEEDNGSLVKQGEVVILVASDGCRYFAEAAGNKDLRVGKNRVNLGALVGTPYGSVFEIGKRKLTYLPEAEHLTRTEASSASLAEDAAHAADNRDLTDSSQHQKLSSDDIQELRLSGASGQEIINALMENSDSWESKTVFSQQKWLARKEQKYAPRLRVVRTDAPAVCQSYFEKHREKCCNLRPDSLAQILAFANIHAGAKTMVFDTCMGVVLGAVLERLGGRGRVLAPYAGTHPSCDATKQFNFSSEVSKVMVPFHTTELGRVEETSGEEVPDESEAAQASRAKVLLECIPEPLARKLATMKSHDARESHLSKRNERIIRQSQKPQPGTVRHWIRSQSDSLIIATHFQPTATLMKFWPYLAPAAPFVVFCEFLEPLVQCFRELQRKQVACKLQLSDTWTREFQVLPGRTHPSMHMSSSSGFLLTGVKVPKRADGWKFVEKVKEGKKPRADAIGR